MNVLHNTVVITGTLLKTKNITLRLGMKVLFICTSLATFMPLHMGERRNTKKTWREYFLTTRKKSWVTGFIFSKFKIKLCLVLAPLIWRVWSHIPCVARSAATESVVIVAAVHAFNLFILPMGSAFPTFVSLYRRLPLTFLPNAQAPSTQFIFSMLASK